MNTTRHTNLSEKKFTTTDNEFQDLHWVEITVKKELIREPNRRMSALFRNIRKNKNYSLIGDYGILWTIAKVIHDLHLKRGRKTFWQAAQYSEEYKHIPRNEKQQWLDTFEKTVSGGIENNNYAFSKAEKEKKV